MSSSSIFSGSALFLENIQQVTPSTLKLKYSQDPLVANPAGVNDALNPSNYTLTGSVIIAVTAVSTVSGDPQSVLLALSNPLPNETWRIAVANVRTAAGNILTSPTYLDFVASVFVSQASISGGAVTETAEDIIRKHLSSALKGPNWDALIAGLAAGDTYVRNLAASAFKQLFKKTASGKYLDKLASDDGFVRPPGVGVSDDVFRKLAIKVGAEKLTLQSFLQVLEAYYGSDALRATVDSTGIEAFNLQDGDDLLIEVEGTLVSVVFKNNDFRQIGQATAKEAASVITRAFQVANLKAYAVPIILPSTGNTIIRIYSGALGLRGAIRVLGGRAQLTLNFPTKLATTQVIGTQWTIDTPATLSGLTANRARLTWIGGTNPTLQLVTVGDYINIYGSVFNVLNRGAYLIVSSTLTYVEIENLNAVNQIGVAQTAANDIELFRPTRFTLNSKDRISVAVQANNDQTDVILAATTEAVGRTTDQAAYLHDNNETTILGKATATSVTRAGATVTINTVAAHGLLAGDTFYLAPGDPNEGQDFLNGIKTVVTVPLTTRLTYTETGGAVSAALPQYIYPCYRNSSGLVTIKTSSAHGLSTNDWIVADELKPDIKVVAPIYIRQSTTGFNALWYLSWSAAVKLTTGDIFECGGDAAGVVKNTARLYSPTTNTWSPASNMGTARSKHTATLLTNGRVLITGGNEAAPIATCEIYDPTTNVWIPAASMANARFAHTATLLTDGRVLVTGGGTAACEVFNPTTGVWATVSSMSVNRHHHQAVLLQDGRVLVCGGYTAYPTGLSSSQVYNPYNNMWATGGNMSSARFYHRALLSRKIGMQGRVIVTGGTPDDAAATAVINIFEPMTLTWSVSAATDPQARWSHSMTEMSNGIIVINGGKTAAAAATDQTSYYDPINDSTLAVHAGFNSRYSHNSFELSTGNILFGPSNFTASDEPELLFPQIGTYTSGGLNGSQKITVLDSTRFTYSTTVNSEHSKITPIINTYLDKEGGTVISSISSTKGVSDINHIGPYVLMPYEGPAITGINTTINQTIVNGGHYSSLTVVNASSFPDSEGYLVFGFGTDVETHPVKYLARINSTTLLLDSSFIFSKNMPVGTNVILLRNRGPLELDSPETTGLFYLTDSVAGRIAASNTIDAIEAAGANVVKTIVYPGDQGLGGEFLPVTGQKISDKVFLWGNEQENKTAHEE